MIELYDPAVYERGVPYEDLGWLRENSPVHWHRDPQGPGFWAVTRHADVVHVSRHPELFSSYEGLAMIGEYPEPDKELQRLLILNQDPPEHSRRRSLVNKGFTPRMISKLEQHIREVCDQLLDRCEGEGDFVTQVAAPLPLQVICELLGAPVADRDLLFDLSNRLIGWDDPEFQTTYEDGQHAGGELMAYGNALAAERMREPRDDLITRLIRPGPDGAMLSPDDVGMFTILLVVAGNETTRNAASNGMQAFFDHPDQWRRLLDDRSLLEPAVEELVRWATPVMQFRRTATADTTIGDQPIRKGDKVVVFYNAANRDPAVFPDPDVFDIGRDPNPHVGFGGGGPHFCLGAHLARMELRVLFETIARRFPDIAPKGEARRLRSNFINGIKEMPVAFRPPQG
ncbi:cytochrome P450 [Nonomuraea africana]|uniref:Cholest-4-en-3-one 26-monooxygenase n=1 Tax=Nonomuraea africana TaxID=46171 RepID=A0ABR9KM38_9ACTN|nr:cytochrome P450 [Nonomuraea africana]MBE1563092.1 cholest-4-en-3-one 26-monooxygenase [Nonomuraea africana]